MEVGFTLFLLRVFFLTSFMPGLSPSIHSIDQIKVVDRFRGDVALLLDLCSFLTTYQKFRMRGQWRILCGQTPIQRRRTLQYLLGSFRLSRDCPSNPFFVLFLQWCRVYIWIGRCLQISRNQQYVTHTPGSSALYGGLCISVRESSIHGMVSAELLLPMR